VRRRRGFVAEKILNFFGAIRIRRQENFDSLTKRLQSWVGGFGSLQAIQVGGEAEAAPTHFQELLIESFFCCGHNILIERRVPLWGDRYAETFSRIMYSA
jgi:hypothetical protein